MIRPSLCMTASRESGAVEHDRRGREPGVPEERRHHQDGRSCGATRLKIRRSAPPQPSAPVIEEPDDPPLRAAVPEDVPKRFTGFRLPVGLDEAGHEHVQRRVHQAVTACFDHRCANRRQRGLSERAWHHCERKGPAGHLVRPTFVLLHS